ncbi:hypothetical protein [Candidatus Cyanaurora vandensis]|uniref:hypothetical protein n=1 Tax=Candidatus Cyanaurora vandensis TaxID=2714958 RepID=UPI0025805AB0|nr:hypothetical protein [Candidatus Cyanaurora vandensis]
MFILDPAQVKPCYVNHEDKLEAGIRVYGKAFRMLANYQPSQLKNAITHCRACLDNHALSIVVKNPSPAGYTVWLQSAERVGEAARTA